MRDAIVFLMGGAIFGIAGWMLRDFKVHLDAEMKIRRTMRDLRAQVDREDAA